MQNLQSFPVPAALLNRWETMFTTIQIHAQQYCLRLWNNHKDKGSKNQIESSINTHKNWEVKIYWFKTSCLGQIYPGSNLPSTEDFQNFQLFTFKTFRQAALGCFPQRKMEVNGAALGLREAPSNAGLCLLFCIHICCSQFGSSKNCQGYVAAYLGPAKTVKDM